MYRVAVLMSTYNGEKYLSEQIDSIIKQRNVVVDLFIRDDGSTDGTISIIKGKMMEQNNIHLTTGNNLYYPKSFLTICKNTAGFDYYAFSDQDDYWTEDKLTVAINRLIDRNENVYSLYASALTVVDKDLTPIGIKGFPGLRTNLGSEISRHRLAGCTMVWTNDLHLNFSKHLNAILEFSPNTELESHDGWFTLFCILSGRKILYDAESHILFRRHFDTATNVNSGIWKRVIYEFSHFVNKDDYRRKLSRFLLDEFGESMDYEAKTLLLKIVNYRSDGIIGKLRFMRTKEIYTGIVIIDALIGIGILFSVY